jgi:hypothetical protein
MNANVPTATAAGLTAIRHTTLTEPLARFLAAAADCSGGSAQFRRRKIAEARDLLALSQIGPPGRLRVEALDLGGDLRARLRLRVATPYLRRDGNGDPIKVAPEAVLHLRYFEEAVRAPQAGYRYIGIESPLGVWHPNVALDAGQPLCLGAKMPAGVRVVELVLLSYAALCLQSVTLDLGDPAGLLNHAAAMYWQQHTERIPLSKTPFLGTDDLQERSQP